MATDFNRPTLLELLARAQADLEGAVTGIRARLRRRFERALAFALASLADSLHGHQQWVADQIFPDTAAERILLRWCSLFGVSRKAAERSAGIIIVTGAGGDIPIGTRYVRRSDGRLYETTALADDVINETVALRAVEGGIDGDMDESEELSLVSPIANVDSLATVGSGGLVNGFDIESLNDLLLRLLDRIQHPPMGGAPGDYVTWAREVSGVTRAWEYRGIDGMGNPGAGRVSLTFVLDVVDGDGNASVVIPDGAKVAEVQAYLEARAPAEAIVFAPVPEPYDATIALSPNTTAVRQAVTAEINDMIFRDAVPGGAIRSSRANEAISGAEGELDHELTLPAGDKAHAFGIIAVPGSLTFTTL